MISSERRSNNLLYPWENKSDKRLFYRCKRCKHKQEAPAPVVYVKNVSSAVKKTSVLFTKDLTMDPTLPRVSGISCTKCGFGEAVYLTIRSNNEDDAMKLMYFCANPECDHAWRPERPL